MRTIALAVMLVFAGLSSAKEVKVFKKRSPEETEELLKKTDVEFKKVEEAIHIKCDVHAWMGAYCFVCDNGYFAVTNPDGSFSIDTTGLPDGEYAIKAWQEVLGYAEGKVTVKDGAGTFSHVFKK